MSMILILFSVLFEPTDRRKAVKPFINKNKLALSTPNVSELVAIATTLQASLNMNCKLPLTIDDVLKLCTVASDYVNCIIVTLGENGVITYRKKNNNVRARLYPVKKISKVANVSGAGDCFTSGFINGLLSGRSEELCVAMGMQAAQDTLCTNNTVPITFRMCNNNMAEYTTLN